MQAAPESLRNSAITVDAEGEGAGRNRKPLFWIEAALGLFVYVPVIAFVFYLTAPYWRAIPHRRLAVTCLATIGVLIFVFVTHRVWWNGSCYGSRFFTDALPRFFLLAVLACAAIPEDRRSLASNPMLAVGTVLPLVSVATNGRGALSWATHDWNGIRPVRTRIFDWSQPQFLAGWVPAHPDGELPNR